MSQQLFARQVENVHRAGAKIPVSQARQRLECGDSSPLSVHERKPDRGGFARAASKSASKLAHSKRWRAIRDAFESPAFGHNSTFPDSLESGAAVTRSFVFEHNIFCDFAGVFV